MFQYFRSSLIFFLSATLIILNSCKQDCDGAYERGFKAGFQAAQEKKPTTSVSTKRVNQVSKEPFTEEKNKKEILKGKAPAYAIETLEYIRKNNAAPSGFVGGRKFGNYEKRLPQKDESGNKIAYQEWDVHPKVAGKNRGAERLVTSIDHAYFTEDHYNTFTQIE